MIGSQSIFSDFLSNFGQGEVIQTKITQYFNADLSIFFSIFEKVYIAVLFTEIFKKVCLKGGQIFMAC